MAVCQRLEDKILGSWKVQECQIAADDLEGTCDAAVGVEFTLNKNRTISWKCTRDVFLLAECDVFDLRFASYAITMEWAAFDGHTLKFTVDVISSTEIILSNQLISLKCVRSVLESQDLYDYPFSLTPALEEGFFSDLELPGGTQKFHVHRIILSLGLPELDWIDSVPLPDLPADVLSTILHFSYSQSLPPAMKSSTAETCIQILDKVPGMEPLLEKCRLYLKSTSLITEILHLAQQIRESMERIISYVDLGQNTVDASAKTTALWQAIKQGIREFVVAVARFVQMSYTYAERKNEFDVDDRVKILGFFRSQVPVVASQLYRMVKRFKNVINGLSPSEKTQLANLILPEVEDLLSTLSAICIELKNILEQLITSQVEGQNLVSDVMKPFHRKQIFKLKKLHDKLMLAVMFLLQKKDTFAELGTTSQIRSIMRNMEFVMEEVPLVVLRLEELMTSLEESFSALEAQLVFTQISSKLGRVISYARQLSAEPNARALIRQMCDMVQREEFSASLAALGLVEQPLCIAASSWTSVPAAADVTGLDMVDAQCKPPKASQSDLARRSLQLLESGKYADLEFELPGEAEAGPYVFRGHRVIVAARCRWFRRALLSGMREAVERKITIPDCSPSLLKSFLEFLYGGLFKANEMTVESLTDLLILADRYEVEDLSRCCQVALAARLDPSNALCLVSVADQWGAARLLDACLAYIANNPDVVDKESLDDLAPHLRQQIQSCISGSTSRDWSSSCSLLNSGREAYWQPVGADSSEGESSSDKESVDLFRELTSEMQAAVEQAEQQHREERLERCIADLVEVLGNHVPRSELVRLAWAADFDVNRAVNFFLSEPRPRESQHQD